MASNRWLGNAVATAQVRVQTITAYDASSLYILTIGQYSISTLGTGGSVTTTALAILTAANLSTAPAPFREITWTQNAGQLIGTADTAGKPITFLLTVSGGTGTVGAASNTTANSGPNDVSNPANWSLGTIPVSTNAVYIDATDVSLLYGLESLLAVSLASLTIGQNFTGTIGLPKQNTDGSTPYTEYRQDYLQVESAIVNVGVGDGNGSGRIKIDNSSGTLAVVNVYNTGSPAESGLESFLWKGTNAGNIVNVAKGSVGIAAFPSEAATVATLNVGYETNQASDAVVRVTNGVTLTTVKRTGGSLLVQCGATTVNSTGEGGSLTIRSSGSTYTTVLADDSAAVVFNGIATITTLTLGPGSSIDLASPTGAVTVTNSVLMSVGSSFNDPGGRAVVAAGFTTVRCTLADVAIITAAQKVWTPS